MKNEVVDNYYTSQKSKLLKEFDKAMKKYGRKILASHYGDHLADTIIKGGRQEYEALIPQLPYIGGKKNPWTTVLLQCAGFLGLYRALKTHGKTAEEAGKISYEMVETQLRSYPKLLRRLVGRWGFTRYSLNKLKKQAEESQKRLYPGDWVLSFVQGDSKEFDYGLDITECAICKVFHAQGADELTPFVCLTDFPMSKAFGMGLVRTMTIAEGAEKCDFRYKRGRKEKQGWPPEFLESNVT
jgi:hypothetical protein